MENAPDFEAIQASFRHGSRARYKAGCRRDECRSANAAYQRRRRQQLHSEVVEAGTASRVGWGSAVVGLALGVALVRALIRRLGTSA